MVEGTSGAAVGRRFRERWSAAALRHAEFSLSGEARCAGRRRPSRRGNGESRSWRGLEAKTRKRGGFTDQTANRACSELGASRGSDRRCPGLSQVGVNPSGRYRASRRGSSGLVPKRPLGWEGSAGVSRKGGAARRAAGSLAAASARSGGSWSCPWFHTTAEADGQHVAWEAPVNSRLGPLV